jgi:hypothetical protein
MTNNTFIKTVTAGPRGFRAVVDLGGGPSTTVAAFKKCDYLGRAAYIGWYPTGVNKGRWVQSNIEQPSGSIAIPAEAQNAFGNTKPETQTQTQTKTVINEIRRDGQRILRSGANVRVQLKRSKGTKRDDGYVVECYDDNTVKVFLNGLGESVVPVDEWVGGRSGTTK